MGFETVVRPVVFPNIRPMPAQSRPPADDPDQGIATIDGSSGQFLDLQYSWSASTSQSKSVETKRRSDVLRVYQMDDDGNVNEDSFIDVAVANKIWMKDGKEDKDFAYQGAPHDLPNIELKEKNKITRASLGKQSIS